VWRTAEGARLGVQAAHRGHPVICWGCLPEGGLRAPDAGMHANAGQQGHTRGGGTPLRGATLRCWQRWRFSQRLPEDRSCGWPRRPLPQAHRAQWVVRYCSRSTLTRQAAISAGECNSTPARHELLCKGCGLCCVPGPPPKRRAPGDHVGLALPFLLPAPAARRWQCGLPSAAPHGCCQWMELGSGEIRRLHCFSLVQSPRMPPMHACRLSCCCSQVQFLAVGCSVPCWLLVLLCDPVAGSWLNQVRPLVM
jgi:hypothetical protein